MVIVCLLGWPLFIVGMIVFRGGGTVYCGDCLYVRWPLFIVVIVCFLGGPLFIVVIGYLLGGHCLL